LASLAGCIAGRPAGFGAPERSKADVRVVDPEKLEGIQLLAKPMAIVFGKKADGTELVIRYLESAGAQGAQYVTELRIVLAVDQPDGRFECTSYVWPEDHSFTTREQRLVQQPQRSRYVPKTVTSTVTEYPYQCQSVMKPVTRTQTDYVSQYDYYSKSYRTVPQTRTVTSYESQQECKTVPVTRTVTRTEYQLQWEYVPPQWQTVAIYHPNWKLKEAEAVCELAGEWAMNRIEGVLHSQGPFAEAPIPGEPAKGP
jgi:hypothetical protein